MNTSTWTKATIVIAIAVILAVAGFFYWKNYYTPPEEEEAAPVEEASLGGEIYTQVTNPVEGELPESTAPAPNPLKGIYKNPFE